MSYEPLASKPNFPELEEEIQKYWQENQTFQKSVQNREGKESFVFYEGPPTANAAPGLHHVLARAFKDAICRFQTMRGKYVPRKAGWDTHGLPVELQIEKKLGISGKKEIENIVPGDREASIAEFNRLCKESVWQFKGDWENLTNRMGYWIDMSDPYITYDPKYIESVWWVLSELHKKKLVYEGHKVVPYCPRCGTALSSHEVAQGYDEVTEPSVFIKFKVKPGQKIGDFEADDNTFILSWTTTPWTLPGNVALAVGEDIDYVKVGVGDEKLILAKERLVILSDDERPHGQDSSVSTPQNDIVEELKGKNLVGLEYEPLFEVPELASPNSHKVYGADFVTTEDGTGVVHTAVMYGEEDYELGEKVGLPKFHTVDETGKFIESVPEVAGRFVKGKETEKKIIEYLSAKNALLKVEDYTHTYPFCWRCSTPLLYYARASWYVRMSELRDKLIENNKDIHWEPAHIKDGRFGEWLREVKDWAISRERYWGTPLPFWVCTDCSHVMVVESLEDLESRIKKSKIKNQKSKIEDPHRPHIDKVVLTCDDCGGEAHRVPEVLDVWFDSGSMPYAQWHYPFENKEMMEGSGVLQKIKSAFAKASADLRPNGPRQFPADYIAEGVDQTRGWFYTLHATATALGLGLAYKSVISHGLILDENGQKMGKSKGNIVAPGEIFDTFGADSIRWYFFTVNQPGENKLFKKEDLAVVQRKVFNIVANVYNYFATYANAAGWPKDNDLSPKDGSDEQKNANTVLDNWVGARMEQTIHEVTKNAEGLNLFRAVRSIEDYINDLSTWYLRRSRGREDDSFFVTLYFQLLHLSQLMAPFAPFFAEDVYRRLYRPGTAYPESVHLSDWPANVFKGHTDLDKNEEKIVSQMAEVRSAAELGNAIRKEAGVKVRQPLGAIWVSRGGKEADWPEALQQVLLEELNVKEFKKTDQMTAKQSGELEVGLDLEISLELQFEGDVRELERAVQAARKSEGLTVGEPAELDFDSSDEGNRILENLDTERLSIRRVVRMGSREELLRKYQETNELDTDTGGRISYGIKRIEDES